MLRMLRELLGAEPAGAGTAFVEALETLGSVLHQRSILFIASDFLPPPGYSIEDLSRPLAVLCRRHEVIALRVSDPRERELPSVGLVELQDPETGQRVLFDTGSRRLRKRHTELSARNRAESDRILARSGVDTIELSTARPFGLELEKYFRMRKRRRTHA